MIQSQARDRRRKEERSGKKEETERKEERERSRRESKDTNSWAKTPFPWIQVTFHDDAFGFGNDTMITTCHG